MAKSPATPDNAQDPTKPGLSNKHDIPGHDPATGEVTGADATSTTQSLAPPAEGAEQAAIADAEPTGEVGEYKIMSKMSAASIGNPKKGASLDKEKGEVHLLGFISGTATGTKAETLPDGSGSLSLTGVFTGESADGSKKIRSGRLFLPGGIHEMVVGGVLKNGQVGFSFELRTKPASNRAGYEYETVSLVPIQEERDRFAAIVAARRKKLGLPSPGYKEPDRAALAAP